METFKRYLGVIESMELIIPIEESEFTTFITHFGQFGNLTIHDKVEDITILKTKGIYIDSFYPEITDRKLAEIKAKKFYDSLSDYKYQKKKKYPKIRLKKLYIVLKDYQNKLK